ncbi:MAG: class I SAM-dependent methyltransferase [Cyanobacteria bacterium J06633_2]
MGIVMTTSDQPQDFQHRWLRYYAAVEGRPPRETLLRALDCFSASAPDGAAAGVAIDLGCGDGRDTVELLRRGWHVLAIDGESEAIARLLNRDDVDLTRLDTRVEKFEELVLIEEAVDLINASFCLPFCAAQAFPWVWQGIVNALQPGGIFCGHLFGDRDSWASNPKTHHLTRPQVEELLQPFTLEWFDEEDHPGQTALGEDKHWHIFNIVARKR